MKTRCAVCGREGVREKHLRPNSFQPCIGDNYNGMIEVVEEEKVKQCKCGVGLKDWWSYCAACGVKIERDEPNTHGAKIARAIREYCGATTPPVSPDTVKRSYDNLVDAINSAFTDQYKMLWRPHEPAGEPANKRFAP